jgi:hypothetical protein
VRTARVAVGLMRGRFVEALRRFKHGQPARIACSFLAIPCAERFAFKQLGRPQDKTIHERLWAGRLEGR